VVVVEDCNGVGNIQENVLAVKGRDLLSGIRNPRCLLNILVEHFKVEENLPIWNAMVADFERKERL
jgi:hypothetical protein